MAPETEIELTEEQRVQRWRQSVLERAGVRPLAAKYLSLQEADLHTMLRAAEAGCSDTDLKRIFGD